MAKSTFWKDFKAFISRGNVVDMAVGVVIGGSFGKIITGLVNYIINPFVGIFVKSGDLDSIRTIITPAKEAVLDTDGVTVIEEAVEEVAILWGSWIQTIIDFIITAFCIFFVLRVITKTKAKLEADKIAAEEKAAAEAAAKAEEDKKAAAEAAAIEAEKAEAFKQSIIQQEKLLAEIRDLMKNK